MNSEKNNKIEIVEDIDSTSTDSNNTKPVSEVKPATTSTQDIKLDTSNVIEESQPNNNSVEPVVKNDNQVEIKESATIKSEVGTSIIGNINGETITPTNNPLPDKIDVSVSVKEPVKANNKKIKVVTKREKIMNAFVVVLILLILGGGGYATYYFAYLNNPSIYTVKNVSFELGETLPTSVSYYVTSPKTIDGMEYSIDLSNVGTSIGTYTYTVIHKSVQKSGTITINDTKGPVIEFNDNLNFSKGSIITKEDIVKSCDDPSNCTYKLETTIDTSISGKKDVNIIANDDIGNSTTLSATINIIDISKTITCTSNEDISTDNSYKTIIEDTINFDSSDNIVSTSSKKIVYYIDNLIDFFTLYNTEKDNTEYTFDRVNFNYSIKNDLDIGDIKTYKETIDYYNQKGYTCK